MKQICKTCIHCVYKKGNKHKLFCGKKKIDKKNHEPTTKDNTCNQWEG